MEHDLEKVIWRIHARVTIEANRRDLGWFYFDIRDKDASAFVEVHLGTAVFIISDGNCYLRDVGWLREHKDFQVLKIAMDAVYKEGLVDIR